MSPRTMLLWSAAVVLCVLALASPSPAQTLYGSLTGNITDASGANVPNAKVEVVNVGTGVVKTAHTDERGGYAFNDLQVGTYKVTFSAPSFTTKVVEGIVINQNTTLRVDSSLQVSQVQESIIVNANAVTLQTDRSDINHVIPKTQVTDLPIMNSQGRNFQALYKILPGFTPPRGSSLGLGEPAAFDGDTGQRHAAVEQ